MAYAKINKTDCTEWHGNVQVRIDFYLEDTDPRYEDTRVLVIDTSSKEYQKGYPENYKITEKEWLESLPKKWQTNPFHSHFMYFSPGVTEAEILKEAEFHLPNFYTAFQNQWDKSDGGMRHGWATEKRIRPTRKDKTPSSKDYESVRLSCEAKIAELSEATTKVINLDGTEYPATEIDIGDAAIDRNSDISTALYTAINVGNPANDTGIIDTIEIYAYSNMTETKVGTFYSAGGSSYTNRDYESIGNVSSGGKRTFTGLDIDVSSGDLIGVKSSGGRIEESNSGNSGILRYASDGFGGTNTYTVKSGDAISLYGTGETVTQTYELSCSDGFSLGETITKTSICELSCSEGISLGDSNNEASRAFMTLEDALFLSDSGSLTMSSSPVALDTVVMGENLNLLTSMQMAISDGFSLSDLTNLIYVWKLFASDSLSISDSLSASALCEVSGASGIELSEGLLQNTKANVSGQSGITLSDETLTALASYLLASSGVSLGDAPRVYSNSEVSVSDAFRLSDEIGNVIKLYLSLSESVTFSDFVIAYLKVWRAIRGISARTGSAETNWREIIDLGDRRD